jgi:hypothetical protein
MEHVVDPGTILESCSLHCYVVAFKLKAIKVACFTVVTLCCSAASGIYKMFGNTIQWTKTTLPPHGPWAPRVPLHRKFRNGD